jgi:hypothetical protein
MSDANTSRLQSKGVRRFLLLSAGILAAVGAVSFATTPGQPAAVVRTVVMVGGPFVSMMALGLIFAYLANHTAQFE